MKFRYYGAVLKDTLLRTVRDKGFPYASQAAFAFAFSLFPLIYLIATTTGLLVREPRLRASLLENLAHFMPLDTVSSVSGYLVSLQATRFLHTQLVFSFLLGLWTASGVIVVWGEAIARAYRVRRKRSFWRKRLRAIAVLLTVGVLIASAFGFLVIAPVVAKFLTKHLGMGGLLVWFLESFGFPIAVLCMSPAYAVLYWMAPAKNPDGQGYVWPGAIFATWVWVTVTWIFRLFVLNFGAFHQTYGSLAGFMILLSWMYLTSLSVIIGAEFNVVLRRHHLRRKAEAVIARLRGKPMAERT